MNRLITLAAPLAFAVLSAVAQEAERAFDFDTMDVEAGILDMNVQTRTINRISDGASIVLHPNTPGKSPLGLHAQEITFTYPPGDSSTPEQIIFKGDVVIECEKLKFTGDAAEWQFDKDLILLTGHPPRIETGDGGVLEGEQMEWNLETGDFRIHKPSGKGLPFTGLRGGERSGQLPGLLRPEDIVDCKGLLGRIKAQSGDTQSSPGKRILGLLSPESKAFFDALPPDEEPSEDVKRSITKQFNSILRRRDFYAKDAWQGIELGQDAAGLLDKGIDALAEDELVRLNRALFQAAYPGIVQKLVAPESGENR